MPVNNLKTQKKIELKDAIYEKQVLEPKTSAPLSERSENWKDIGAVHETFLPQVVLCVFSVQFAEIPKKSSKFVNFGT